MLRPSGQGLGSLAYDIGAQTVEGPLQNITQRALVDPLLDGASVDGGMSAAA